MMASSSIEGPSPAPLSLHQGSSSSEQQPTAPSMSSRPTASSTSTATPLHKDEQDLSKIDISSPHELTAFVDDVLSRLETTFDNMSSQVLDRLEAISKRIDTVEMSISDLMQGNTLVEEESTTAAAKPSTES